ncbi:MAG: DUF4442 domain-containing protein [Chitinophagaceae bacterium]|nr:MAG: DUF4442 domain-containing protein [Chitinophagaceae bacterium]
MVANEQFVKLMNHPVKFRLFLLSKLPSAYFSGLKIKSMTPDQCTVTIPYKWFSQNPFRSTYFACLAMAGEMSTGSLAMAYVYKHRPSISMLVVKLEANYFKKADGLTAFTCIDGPRFRTEIQRAVDSGDPVSFTAKSTGVNQKGELVAEFFITWSFKRKST